MESETNITIVRLYLPEASHSARKTQLEKVLHLLRDQLHVHGVTVLTGVRETGSGPEPHYGNVGDVLRRTPDPPTIVEFFDETPAAAEIRRLLRELVPESQVAYWQATWERGAFASAGEHVSIMGTGQRHF